MRQQPFASPEEALAHFGIKGMRWGVRKERDTIGDFSNWGKPYTHADGIGHGSKDFELTKVNKLRVDHSNGFAEVVPTYGFKTTKSKQMHDELITSLKVLREEHPAVANLKIVVAPSSHIPGGPGGSTQAAVLHVKRGEVFITYNDKIKDFSPRKQKSWEKWVPGMKYPGYVGRHEMGHVLAISGKLTPPCWDMVQEKNYSKKIGMVYGLQESSESNHKAAFSRHGMTFKEVSKLSPYAATSASEAYAEVVGNYYTPALNQKMSPAFRRKAKSMIDEAGGK